MACYISDIVGCMYHHAHSVRRFGRLSTPCWCNRMYMFNMLNVRGSVPSIIVEVAVDLNLFVVKVADQQCLLCAVEGKTC